MPRYDSTFPHHRSAPRSAISGIIRQAWTLLWPSVAASGRICWANFAKFVEGGGAREAASNLHSLTLRAIRWARKNDTVPEGTAKAAIIRHEERAAQADIRRAAAEQKRQERDEKRREREKRYAEKSSIYLG
ncbi:MAG: hypothetical protein WCJ64_26955 [Rhodospirillaceae bacterium]